uniref:Uncharacterized protein n=1 Tax=Poecilia reticulata TaxID=8081 RepID=A0A3P9QF83_POERE
KFIEEKELINRFLNLCLSVHPYHHFFFLPTFDSYSKRIITLRILMILEFQDFKIDGQPHLLRNFCPLHLRKNF